MSTFPFSKDKLPKQLIINNEYVDSRTPRSSPSGTQKMVLS